MSVYLWKWFDEGGTDPLPDPPEPSKVTLLATRRVGRIKRRGSPQAEARVKEPKWRPMRGRK